MSWSHKHAMVFLVGLAIAGGSAGCKDEPPPRPPAPPPAPVAPVAPAVDARPRLKLPPAPTDGLSLMERVQKRKAEEAKVASELAQQETDRLLKYDRTKIPQHTAVFAFTRKTRKALDEAAAKWKGKPDGAAQIEKLQAAQHKAIVAQGKTLVAIDAKGGNSNIVTDHDVMLNALANDYPAAIVASFAGDEKALQEQRVELDKRDKKIEAWLVDLKKKPKK